MRALDRPGRSPVHSRHGMVCSSQALASDVGLDVLKAGGNAMDAAIATCAMQCVVEPAMTGVGGDCFCLYAPGGRGRPLAYNGSGRAPAAATPEALRAAGVTALERGSPHSVIVPGAIDAWTRLHADHGRMPFAELLAPAVRTAREGWPLSSRVAVDIAGQVDFLKDHARTARIHLDGGRAPAVGSLRRLPELAEVLECIGREGRACMYEGEYARDMVEELRSLGGLHSMDDFRGARGDYVVPISTRFRGLDVWQCPPNGQGVIALLLLKMFESMPPGTDGAAGALAVDRLHLEIEACRRAYAVRDARLADPDFAHVPVERILSDEHVAALLGSIDRERHVAPCPEVELFEEAVIEHRDTVYISVVDRDRNACSFINTLFWAFGSGITTPGGITLTNRGQGFSLDPASPNAIAPGKRPRHTIIPAMAMRDDAVRLCFGVMGGEYQAMGHLQFLTRHLDFGLDLQEAMDLPRFMADPDGGEVEVESGIDAPSRAALGARGHRIVAATGPIGGSQAISIDPANGVLTGATDPRKDGAALGY